MCKELSMIERIKYYKNHILNIIYSIPDLQQVSSQYATTLLSKPLGNGRGAKSLREILGGAPSDAIDLIEKLLVFSPERRLTAEQALKHPYVAR